MTPTKSMFLLGALVLGGCASDPGPRPTAPANEAGDVEISPAGSRPPTAGPAEMFTGNVSITPLFEATEATLAAGMSVSFEPGARTAWHSHPAGQTLIVTEGTGWVQEWGGVKQELHAGDVVWTPPGVRHWHGATSDEAMTHIAVIEHLNGKVVDWFEHVSDEDYSR